MYLSTLIPVCLRKLFQGFSLLLHLELRKAPFKTYEKKGVMRIKDLFILFFPLILSACNNDEPEPDFFHLTVGTEADTEVAMGIHSAEIVINGDARWIDVGIVGDFDSYIFSDDVPDWMAVLKLSDSPCYFRIEVSEFDDVEPRVGKVAFTVFKGSKSQSGSIAVTQQPSFRKLGL